MTKQKELELEFRRGYYLAVAPKKSNAVADWAERRKEQHDK